MSSKVASVVPVAEPSLVGALSVAARSSDTEPAALRERMVDALCTALDIPSSVEEGGSRADAG